jgi:hypothetical protein
MKHIKKYNENNNLDYYQEVTSSEYHSIRGERERLLFTDDEKATIKKIDDNWTWCGTDKE